MSLRTTLLVSLVALLSPQLIACSSPAPSAAARHFALSPTVILSEVLFDPPGTDSNNEYVELQCTPSVALDAYWLVILEGDYNNSAPTERGTIWFAKALTGITCGSNGFVILQLGTVHDGVAGTTYVDNFFTQNLQNGTQTLWLLQTDTFSDANNDLDDNDDGVIDDSTLLPKIVDSVAVSDGYVDDLTYSPALLVKSGVDIDAISRFAGTTDTSAASWYFGSVKGPSPFTYDTNSVSDNFPPGGTLEPGTANTVSPTLDLTAGPPADLVGSSADLVGSGGDLTTGGSADLGAGGADAATTNDAATASDDLAEPPAGPDLRRPRDLGKAPDLDESGTASPPDLRSGGSTSGADRRRGCSTVGGAPDPAALLLLLLALPRRRRP